MKYLFVCGRQHCHLSICIELDELTNSIRQQDPNIYSDTEARCLSSLWVCHEKWSLPAWSPLKPPVTTLINSRLVFIVFHSSKLVFHGSRWVSFYGFCWFQVCLIWFQVGFIVFQGSRSIFHGSRWIFMVFHGSGSVFHGSRWIFMGLHGSQWVFTVFHGSRSFFHDFRLFFYSSRLVYIQAERRRQEARCWEQPKKYPLDLYLGPTIPLGPSGRRPALA